MFEIDIDGKKAKAEVSFYTAYLYEAEFNRDLIKDLFGVLDSDTVIEFEGDSVVKVDFTRIDWNATLRALWAACKTAKESVPSFSKWIEKAKGANLWLARELLAFEVNDCFFRTDASGEENQG